MKKVLFANGSYNEIPLIKSAHKFGYYVITSGNDPKGEGHRFSDKYIACDYSNKEALLAVAKENKVDAICSCGNDFAAISAAYAAEKLSLPGHDTYENTRFFHEKNKFKELCKQLGLPTSLSFSFDSIDAAIKHLSSVKYPQIIKPSDLGGGKGVSVVYDYNSAVKAISRAYDLSKIKVILIEDYIEGKQYGFTCFIRNKKVVFNYLSEDYSYLNPYMVWTAVSLYPNEEIKLRKRIVDDVEKAAGAINIYDGFLTIQLIVRDGEPFYIETMRRCLGNMHYLCLSNDFGIDMYDLFMANELGLSIDEILSSLREQKKTSAFMGIYSDSNGRFVDYSISSEFNRFIFYRYDLAEKESYVIDNYLSDKLGMVFLSFENKADRDLFLKEKNSVMNVKVIKEGF